jgi:hypothetical protein
VKDTFVIMYRRCGKGVGAGRGRVPEFVALKRQRVAISLSNVKISVC